MGTWVVRIKKKTPKPSAKRPPLYFIGYRGTPPQSAELKTWYDLEYGGPLAVGVDEAASESWTLRHGPWSAHVVLPLPSSHSAGLKEQLAWEHESMGAVAPSVVSPRDMPDAVLFAARLARGLTLLSQGTAYDLTTDTYLNPSDWRDRPLGSFSARDHVTVMEAEADDGRQWLYSLGLKKFGLDEVEWFQPAGLPTAEAREQLTDLADELIRRGENPKVGSTFPVSGRLARIVRHRTAAPSAAQIVLREVLIS
ncbi:MAG TPA: hypothetical protein VFS39_02470 [Nitrospira sp.]|nr:hypothetical protein [Nitrospira sp.]